MKKITFVFAAVLMFGQVIAANQYRDLIGYKPELAAPISFMERGIEFFVFMDGQLDFNTYPSAAGSLYYKDGRRSVNQTYGAPGVNSGGVVIEHDNMGRVRRVGNVFINYDAQNRIKRVGSVYMTYNKQFLSQIGGLKISYDRRGYISDVWGHVNSSDQSYQGTTNSSGSYYGPATGYNDNLYYKPTQPVRR
jgi:hypothetical protein